MQAQQLAARSATTSALLRKHTLDKVVPAVASLKAHLEEAHHPMQAQALQCLVRLMLEHKEHMEEALVTQRRLAAEIKCTIQDSQKAARAARTQRKNAASAEATGARPTPQTGDALGQPPPAPGKRLSPAVCGQHCQSFVRQLDCLASYLVCVCSAAREYICPCCTCTRSTS